jgi:hypothetical protein
LSYELGQQQKKEAAMRMMFRSAAAGAALLAGSVLAAAPANAGVHVGIGIGVPGPVYADPCYGPYPYPGYCTYPVFYGPVYYAGGWHHGPYRYRVINGRRHFWVGNHWQVVRVGHGRFAGPRHGHHRHRDGHRGHRN